MTLILNGTTGISGVDGSAATPAFKGNDSNTGISFGTDIVTINTGGTARVTTDASGNVGIGTVAAGITGAARLQVAGSGTTAGMALYRTDAPLVNASICGIDGVSYDGSAYVAGGTINFRAAENWTATNHGTVIQFRTTASGSGGALFEAMRINSDGNVGIGTTTPSVYGGFTTLEVGNTSGNAGLFSAKHANGNAIMYNAGGIASFGSTGAYSTTFISQSVERMRIDTSGNLLVGQTSWNFSNNGTQIAANGRIYNTSNTDYNLELAGSTSARIRFYTSAGGSGTTVGTITVSGSATTYATSSDYRLKENVSPMTGALATVAQLKPVTYTWKSDGSAGQGFIAHELQAVVPDCVTGTKDAVDAEGKPQYQGVDTSFLVATVVAALQELKAEVDSLKAQLQGAA